MGLGRRVRAIGGDEAARNQVTQGRVHLKTVIAALAIVGAVVLGWMAHDVPGE
jgi:hypothetical protein